MAAHGEGPVSGAFAIWCMGSAVSFCLVVTAGGLAGPPPWELHPARSWQSGRLWAIARGRSYQPEGLRTGRGWCCASHSSCPRGRPVSGPWSRVRSLDESVVLLREPLAPGREEAWGLIQTLRETLDGVTLTLADPYAAETPLKEMRSGDMNCAETGRQTMRGNSRLQKPRRCSTSA